MNEIWEGDSLELIPALPDGINCVITDPPYGVNFVSRRAVTPGGKAWAIPVANDDTMAGAVALFRDAMDLLLPKCADEAELYVFTRWDIVGQWIVEMNLLEQYEFSYKMMLVWDKGIPGMGDIDANWGCGHEIILYCKRGRRDIKYRRSSIIAVDKVHPSELIHPTEKPVALLEKFIEMSTDPGDVIVDPFAGSGSTVVAAMRQGRNSIGIEKDSEHVRRARQRLTQPTMF